MSKITLVFEAPDDMDFGTVATINGIEVPLDAIVFRDETESVSEMKELLAELYEGPYLCDEYKDYINELLVNCGYWTDEVEEALE